MAFPELSYTTDPLRETKADALVLALPPLDHDAGALDQWPGLASALNGVGFSGALGATVRAYAPEATSLPLIVVGTGPAPDTAALREAVGAALRTTIGFDTVAVEAPAVDDDGWRAVAEGAVLGAYRFDGYKSVAAAARASHVVIRGERPPAASALARAQAVGDAAALVKDLVHTPAEWLGPQDVADAAREALAELPVDVVVLDEKQLAADGYGGILGVGQGSERPPRLVRLDYAPADAERHVAIVGKGITFDTGGLSLKPPAGMVGMKYDMAGAATVLAVVRAAAQLRLPVRVSGWLCLADNMPSGRATRPGDVLRILGGTTVEVLNTDAEGRLVLADGLVAASRTHPDVIIDVATLTGAISVALGSRHTGVMGSEEAVAEYLDAAESADELAWPLPLPAHMEEELDSPIADLVNAKIGDPTGGSLFAGLFLQRFVGRVSDDADAPRIPWVHLDIAGSGSTKSATGATDKGPTAATVRSLLAFVEGDAR
ncbi:leucyl aminopeptidase [Microbacterium laevaniformans]|uniref:leucyl aminopeptidase n=1 Tax=Microbacterium laevaniformans TaxID=36807 RepID=UPI00195CA644|nr:leucyl aminopeptidase [Microbacterium laevaniformans]MBM7752449.1 leucyl aminopeptidase [Microbacterium laevaniformans]GLJ64987.1 putative cytosol aminopeptidase [Microbacterium laevaniformans]